jgi:hypothetical protein
MRVWNPLTQTWWRTDLYQESAHTPESELPGHHA